MTTQHFSEEPADGTILANSDLTEVINRDDATAKSTGYRPREHWWQAGEDVGPATWAEVSRVEWQRLYRQSDVDASHSALREIAALHADSPAGFCPKCFRVDDVSDTDDGLVAWPCETVRIAWAALGWEVDR
ncbi:MAG TPA: hypothetical protein VHA75_18325 [Rugosimonospora sp.]|nr:hypothetical protein [Rugosimonospora sp.]